MTDTVHPESLEIMRKRGGTWAVYENQAMDSALLGHLQFLKVGPDCTHEKPPRIMPDTEYGPGWKYLHIGTVDLETGAILPEKADEPS